MQPLPGRRFVGEVKEEWNGKFRDDIRSFLKGDNGTARTLATG